MLPFTLAQALPAPAPPVLPPAGTVAGAGAWLDGFVNSVGTSSAVWSSNATVLMGAFGALLVTLAVVFTLMRSVVETQSAASIGWMVPRMLWQLMPVFFWIGVASVFVVNLVPFGLGLGSYVSGSATGLSANSLAVAFFNIMAGMIKAPFTAYANLPTYFLATVTNPGVLGLLAIEELVAIGLSFFILLVGVADCLMLVFVQVDAYVIGPLLLLLVPFRALDSTLGLFNAAVQGWMQRVFRLVAAVVISGMALVILAGFPAQIASINAQDPVHTFQAVVGAFFWIALAIMVIGGLTVTLPFAIGAVLGGSNIANAPAVLQRVQSAASGAVKKIASGGKK